MILSSKNGKIDGDFAYPNLGFGKSRDLERYNLNSSQEYDELVTLPVKKSKNNGKLHGVSQKSKKVKENGVMQKKKSKRKGKNGEVDSNCVEFTKMIEHVDG